jgi:hypothetical protein
MRPPYCADLGLRDPGQAGAVEVTFGRARSRYGGDRTDVEGLAAVRAHGHGRDDMAARGMPGLDGRAAGRRPLVAPLPHGRDHLPEVAALAGEPVFRARRVIGVSHPLENLAVDEVVQPLGEDVAGDPEPGLEVIEAGHAEEGVPDDEQAPPFPHDVKALGDRAGHVLKAGPLHEH